MIPLASIFAEQLLQFYKRLEQLVHEFDRVRSRGGSLGGHMEEDLVIPRNHVRHPIAVVRNWAKTTPWAELK